MSGEMVSLARKEWRERRVPLMACTGWILCCFVYVVAYEWTYRHRDPVASYYQVCSLSFVFIAVFLAMKTSLGETTQGTLRFSMSLPVSRRRLAAARLAGGVLTIALPIVLGAVLITPILGSGAMEQAQLRPQGDYVPMPERPSLFPGEAVMVLWTVTAIAVASGTQLLLILSVIGARRTNESQIGFAGAVLAFAWLMLGSVRMDLPSLDGWVGALFPVSFVINWGYGTANGSYSDLDLGQPVWGPLAVNLLVLAALAWWFVCRYGTRPAFFPSARSRFWARRPAVWSHLPIWLPNEAASLIWVNLRQSVSMTIWGLALAVGITLVTDGPSDVDFRSQLPGMLLIVAMLWAAVVGAGVFAAELQPELSRFWRSRPISVARWFWCKYFIGLVAVLAVLDGVVILYSWGTPIDFTSGMSWSYVVCMPIVHGTIYSVAVLGICALRRPILGGGLAIGGYIVAAALVMFLFGESWEPINVYNGLLGDEIQGKLDITAHHFPLVFSALVSIAAASAWLAFQAIRSPEPHLGFWRRFSSVTS